MTSILWNANGVSQRSGNFLDDSLRQRKSKMQPGPSNPFPSISHQWAAPWTSYKGPRSLFPRLMVQETQTKTTNSHLLLEFEIISDKKKQRKIERNNLRSTSMTSKTIVPVALWNTENNLKFLIFISPQEAAMKTIHLTLFILCNI